MNILMISLDSAMITRPNDDPRRRHLDYAERAGHLTIFVYAPPGTPTEPLSPSPHLNIVPIPSPRKVLFPLAVWQAARRYGKVDLIVAQDLWATGLAGVALRRSLRAPLLVQNHTTVFNNPAWIAERPWVNRLRERLARFVRHHADFYRVVNQQEYDDYRALGRDDSRIALLPLATASEAFARPIAPEICRAKRLELGISPDAPLLLWVGIPAKVKRLPLLLEMFATVHRQNTAAQLLLVGITDTGALKMQARALGIGDAVNLHPSVAHADLPLYYQIADLYVHTSSYEGRPRVLFEAGAAGLPRVALDAVGVREAIHDGVDGYLILNDDVDAMAACTLMLLAEPERMRSMGAAAQTAALAMFSADGYAEAWVGLWERAIKLGKRSSDQQPSGKRAVGERA